MSPPAVLQTFFVPPSPDPDDGHVEPTPAFRFRLVREIHLFTYSKIEKLFGHHVWKPPKMIEYWKPLK